MHDILNISILQFHSSTNDLNNEHCKRTHSIENWRNSFHKSSSLPSINEYKISLNSSSLSSLSVKPAIFSQTKSASCCGMKSPDTHFGSIIPSIVMSRLRIYWFCSFPNSYHVVNAFQMFFQTVSAWKAIHLDQYFQRHHTFHTLNSTFF